MRLNLQQIPKVCSIEDPDNIWDHLAPKDSIQFFWLGIQPYMPIWKLQKELHEKRIAGEITDVVLLLEHYHVYTFGKNADKNHLLDSKPKNTEVVQIDRGGEVTYHGPGQLVGYPIVDLHDYYMSVTWYMRTLESIMIHCLKKFNIKSSAKPGLAGVWIEDEKICAMGVRMSRWVTMHGFALNLNPDMKYFDGMIPCGIKEYGVTSLFEQMINIEMHTLVEHIVESFVDLFIKEKNEIQTIL